MEHLSKSKWHKTYLEIAYLIAKHSYSKRKKVGAILVKDNRIISTGYNGTPSGFDNVCEYPTEDKNLLIYTIDSMVTKAEVLHAESNAIAKCAKSVESSEGAVLYVTMSPCFECAKLIIQSGISEVYYSELYAGHSGLELLTKSNIKTKKI